MANINRTNISLPADVSQEILQKTQEQSAVMALARQVALPGRGASIPVITGDPTAAWVGETEKKPVSNPTVEAKTLRAYKLAVIETFSDEFVRDAKALYDELIKRLPNALGITFDKTVIGAVVKPGSDFDNLAACTGHVITADTAYDTLVAADADVAVHGGILTGHAISPQLKSILLAAKDGQGRPLFNAVTEKDIPMILGAQTLQSKGMYDSASKIVGVSGDWTQAMYGTVEGVKIDISKEATVGDINLWQQNMVAVRAEIEIGFRADTSCFNLIKTA